MSAAGSPASTGTTVLEALKAGMSHAMEADPDVILLGEDVARAGGIFRTSTGLFERFGPERVIDTPLDEKGIAAHGVGLSLYGLKPIIEIQFSGFIHDAFEHIMFCAARYRWSTGGQYSCPLVIRAPSFGGIKGGFWHSQSVESYFVHHGGMKILCPSTPEDAYRMMLAAIADPDPVLLVEPVPLHSRRRSRWTEFPPRSARRRSRVKEAMSRF
jgi:pyruvate/2-oxoglutarate/acetoin dehydrogenase E1 component